MKHPKLLVAGAGGLNGRLLLKKLAENNIPVRAMVRNKESTKELENETTEIVEADLSSPAALDRAFERISLPPYIRMLQHISAIFFRLPKSRSQTCHQAVRTGCIGRFAIGNPAPTLPVGRATHAIRP